MQSTNTSRVFHVETMRKLPLSYRFNVEYTWCECKDARIVPRQHQTVIKSFKRAIVLSNDTHVLPLRFYYEFISNE